MIFIAETVQNNAGILEKLFTWKYFEPVLFGSIGVLLILLFIVLFLGKKDQKKKLEETKKLELSSLTDENTVDAFAKEEAPEVAVEAKEEDIPPVVITDDPGMNMDTEVTSDDKPVEVPTESDVVPDFEIFGKTEAPSEDVQIPEPVVTDIPEVVEENYDLPVVEDVVKSVVAPEEPIKNDIVSEEETDKKIESFKENFADLASSISKELDEINRMQQESAEKEIELPKEVNENDLPKEVEVNSINEESKFAPSSIFSSVYSPNSIKDDEKPVLKNENEFELPKKEELDNPFADEMPAIKEDSKVPEKDETPVVNAPDFSAFGNETFDIK